MRPILALFGLLLTIALTLPLERASIAPPQRLYTEAQEADVSEAQATYARLQLDFPQVSEYLLLASARAEMPSVEAVQVLNNIIEFRPQSPAAFEAHLTLARYYAPLGDAQAETEYRAALDLENSLALRLELGRYLEEAGRQDEAYAEYKALLPSYPKAFIYMRSSPPDLLTLAQDLDTAYYFNDALESLRQATDPAAAPLRAQALLGLGHYEEAKVEYEAILRASPADQNARFGLAKCLAALGDSEGALAEYRQVETPDSLLAQAELMETTGTTDRALDLYAQVPYPYAWWRSTAILEGEGREAEAIPLYDKLAESGTAYADDSAYRMYVLAQRSGETQAMETALALLDALSPNYLDLRARGAQFSAEIAPPLPSSGEVILQKVKALETLGLGEMARRELSYAARFADSPAMTLAMAEALVERGYLSRGQSIAEVQLKTLSPAPLALWRLSYPKPFQKEVQAAAQEFSLDPLLIWAIIRQESRFDPYAVSGSMAQGLMQVIPSTRAWITEQMGIQVDPAHIFDAGVNIRLGAWYLHFLLDYFDGDLDYALAAYNGGPGNVDTWKANPQVKDKADFLRWISNGEAREYVSRVLLSYQIYSWLEQMEAN